MSNDINLEDYLISTTDMTVFQIKLMPYSCIYFMLLSYAQIISAEKAYHEQLAIVEITSSAFELASMMVKCAPKHNKYIAYCTMY